MGTAVRKITLSASRDIPFNKLVLSQGTCLVGQYDSQVAFGQSRALLVWNRLIMPNGRSIVLEGQPDTGQGVIEPAKLVAPMLARFMATDRAFAKLRRTAPADSWPPLRRRIAAGSIAMHGCPIKYHFDPAA